MNNLNAIKPTHPRVKVPNLRILPVEDDALIGLLLAERLAGMGHAVCATVTTEAEAIIAAERLQPEMIIIDVRLASGDGIGAIRTIFLARLTAHVFMTGGGADHFPGDAAVLRKPFWETDLMRALVFALSHHAMNAGSEDKEASKEAVLF